MAARKLLRPLRGGAILATVLFGFAGGSDLAVAQSTSPSVSSRQVSEAERIARRYVAAYSAADWGGMAPLMSEDFVFVDRTSPDLAGQEFQGKGAALAMLRSFGEQGRIIGLFLDFPVVFESSGIVVFSGHVNTLSRAAEPGYGLRWRAEQVIILTIKNGAVSRHEDYANYTAPTISREVLESDPRPSPFRDLS